MVKYHFFSLLDPYIFSMFVPSDSVLHFFAIFEFYFCSVTVTLTLYTCSSFEHSINPKENGSAMKNDHSCYVHTSSHWQFTSKAPSLPTHGPLYWDLSLGRSVLPPVAPLLILRQEAGLGHFPSCLPEALSPMLEKLASWSVLILIPLWNIYSKSEKFHL